MKNFEPLISVLMTAYNRERYIADAIKSVLSSDYLHFELIIVDDCSTDNTVAIAKSFEAKDSRIKVYVNEKNVGQFANRNKAAFYAHGRYLKYVDSDDLIYSYTLRLMTQMMLAFPEAGLGFCHTIGDSPSPFPYLIKPEDAYHKHYFEGGMLYTGPIGLIISKAAFDSVEYFEDYGMPSDNHLSLKIAAKFPVVAMPRDLFYWRLHGNQAFAANSSLKNIFDNFLLNKDILTSGSCPFNATKAARAIRNNSRVLLKNVVRNLVRNPFSIKEVYFLSKRHR
jgi:glycosyltransferase involved in cell wall biosynthesis